MAQKINRLNTRGVAALLERLNRDQLRADDFGRHADGGGLYLSISPNGGARWVFLYRWHGKPTELGFGSARAVALSSARAMAAQAREQLAAGINPKDARKPKADLTFDGAARALIESMAPAWRNAKHRAQWHMTLLGEMPPDQDGNIQKTRFDYCAAIRGKQVSKLSTEDALHVLKPLWQTRPETASRLRGRCERVWDYTKARGHCSGQNPFLWRGHLDALLPKRQRLTRGHHAAMSFAEVPAFVGKLRSRDATAALALEFAILTAARSGEVLGARWDEFDLDAALWTVPAARMKAGIEHRVPLSSRALAIIKKMHENRSGDFVFPGGKPDKSLSSMALEMVLRRMKITDVTVHGFRSSFRDWAGDRTAFPRDVVEAALAHVIENKAEAAYRRGTAIEKRRKLMEAWAAYCDRPAGDAKVVRPQFGGRRVSTAANKEVSEVPA
jgi:integrase